MSKAEGNGHKRRGAGTAADRETREGGSGCEAGEEARETRLRQGGGIGGSSPIGQGRRRMGNALRIRGLDPNQAGPEGPGRRQPPWRS